MQDRNQVTFLRCVIFVSYCEPEPLATGAHEGTIDRQCTATTFLTIISFIPKKLIQLVACVCVIATTEYSYRYVCVCVAVWEMMLVVSGQNSSVTVKYK